MGSCDFCNINETPLNKIRYLCKRINNSLRNPQYGIDNHWYNIFCVSFPKFEEPTIHFYEIIRVYSKCFFLVIDYFVFISSSQTQTAHIVYRSKSNAYQTTVNTYPYILCRTLRAIGICILLDMQSYITYIMRNLSCNYVDYTINITHCAFIWGHRILKHFWYIRVMTQRPLFSNIYHKRNQKDQVCETFRLPPCSKCGQWLCSKTIYFHMLFVTDHLILLRSYLTHRLWVLHIFVSILVQCCFSPCRLFGTKPFFKH